MATNRLARMQATWDLRRRRAERGVVLVRSLPWMASGLFAISLWLSWETPYLRGLVLLALVLFAPGLVYFVHWLAPRSRAMFALPFEEYLSRARNLRTPLTRRRTVMAGTVATIGFTLAGLGIWEAASPPNTEPILFGIGYPLWALALFLWAASIVLSLPLYRHMDATLLGESYANRLRNTAIAAVTSGIVLIGIALASARLV